MYRSTPFLTVLCPAENVRITSSHFRFSYFTYQIHLEMTHFETLHVKSNSSQKCRFYLSTQMKRQRKEEELNKFSKHTL